LDAISLKLKIIQTAPQVKEIKNGRLAMIAIGGMTHHYFLTGKGPIEFITQVNLATTGFLFELPPLHLHPILPTRLNPTGLLQFSKRSTLFNAIPMCTA
jgi:hypothetical protein